MPDWFLWTIVILCIAFAIKKGNDAAAASKRKKAAAKNETRAQRIRRIERELRELKRERR